MKPSGTLHSWPGPLLGGWREIAADAATIAAVMLGADGQCHCAHVGNRRCSCCTLAAAHLHDVCDACDRLLTRLDRACAALADHSQRFTVASAGPADADQPARERFGRLCAIGAELRRVLLGVEMRKGFSSGTGCASSDLVRLAPVARHLETLARALNETVSNENQPWVSD